MKRSVRQLFALGLCCLLSPCRAFQQSDAAPAKAAGAVEEGLVIREGSATQVLQSIGAKLRQGVSLSEKVRRKRLSGSFDLADPRALLDYLATEVGLVWYSDGKTLYVYESSEIEQYIGQLTNTSIGSVERFLESSGLLDPRFPLRGGAQGVFHLSAPPIYVRLVSQAASQLDALRRTSEQVSERMEVIRLKHTFAATRTLVQRDQTTTVPGMAEVLTALLIRSGKASVQASNPAVADDPDSGDNAIPPVAGSADAASLTIVPYEPGNSLIVRGSQEQIEQVHRLVRELDVAHQQVELSLWIIDLRKRDLEALGVQWGGASTLGGRVGVEINPGTFTTTLNGAEFLAVVSALRRKGQATIVSRPLVLTQENTPALFDSNTTFYTRLIGERTSQLQGVTYGTLVRVLSRVSDARDVELRVTVEDGAIDNSRPEGVDTLPVVARTHIDTVARVPRDLSLLIGGYTRASNEREGNAIPGLSRVPLVGWLFRARRTDRNSLVRLFLIQPRVLVDAAGERSEKLMERYGPAVGRSLQEEIEHMGVKAESL